MGDCARADSAQRFPESKKERLARYGRSLYIVVPIMTKMLVAHESAKVSRNIIPHGTHVQRMKILHSDRYGARPVDPGLLCTQPTVFASISNRERCKKAVTEIGLLGVSSGCRAR